MLCTRRPLCFMAVFYALGLLGERVPAEMAIAMLAAALVMTLIETFRKRKYMFLMMALAFLCMGVVRMGLEQRMDFVPPKEPVTLTARIVDCAKIDWEKGYASLEIDHACTTSGDEIAPGRKIRLYVRIAPERIPQVGGMIEVQDVRLSQLRGRRNPGGFDQEGYYRSRGVVMTASAGDEWTVRAPEGLNTRIYQLRSAIRARIQKLFTYAAPMFEGMLLGEKDGIDESVYADIRLSGLAHLLAVSGLHVSALIGFAMWIVRKRQISLKASTVLLLSMIWSIALVTGASASTLRACVMGSAMVVARLLHERYDTPCALASAFLGMTIYNPWYVRDVGFVLSFTTVGGILLLQPTLTCVLERPLRKHKRLAQMISISLSAQLACLPFQMLYFGRVSVVGILLNLLCVPLATTLVIGGVLLLCISVIALPVAQLVAPVFRIGASTLQGITQAASNIPFAAVRVGAPTAAMIAAYYAMLFVISPFFAHARRVKAMCFALTLILMTGLFTARHVQPPVTRYVTLDVGQGDCAVLQSREGAVCIIDAGPEGNSELTGYLHHEGLAADVLILSHLDSDHAGGILSLEQARIPVEKIILPYGIDESEVSADVLRALAALEKRGSKITGAQIGDVLSLPGIEIAILGPESDAEGSNERSLVTRIVSEGVTILSMGDTPAEAEPLRGVKCDIVKIAHHGSKSSTSDLFLDFALPETAVISVGRNAFGHPSDEVLARLAARGVEVWRTDECGEITMTISNGEYQIKTMLHTGE